MKKGTLKKVFNYTDRYRGLIILSMVLSVLVALLSLYVPILAGNAVDLIVGPGRVEFEPVMNILFRIVVTVLIIALCQWIMNVINNRITFGWSQRATL